MDWNSAIIDYVIDCPTVKSSPLFFNFGKEGDSHIQFVTKGNDTFLHQPYIDGSVEKRYSFTLFIYKTVSDLALSKTPGYSDENMDDVAEVQKVIDWITEQNDNRVFPDFGEKCIIDEISVTTENPIFNGVDTSASPALARYSFTVNVNYLDKTKILWEV